MTGFNTTMAPLVYNGEIIAQRDEMLSLTDMWKAAGSPDNREPFNWARKEGAAFIEAVAISHNLPEKQVMIAKPGKGGGTQAHWQIGLAYAKYLSPEFHMWCNTVVRERMEGAAATPSVTAGKLDAREARLTFTNFVKLGRLLKLDGNQAILSANKATREIVGIDMLSAMGVTHLVAPTDNASLTPTTMGQQIGGMSARSINDALSRHGYQTSFRDAKGHLVYEPTAKGRGVGGYMTDTGKRHSNGTPVKQLMWTTQSMGALRADLQMETA